MMGMWRRLIINEFIKHKLQWCRAEQGRWRAHKQVRKADGRWRAARSCWQVCSNPWRWLQPRRESEVGLKWTIRTRKMIIIDKLITSVWLDLCLSPLHGESCRLETDAQWFKDSPGRAGCLSWAQTFRPRSLQTDRQPYHQPKTRSKIILKPMSKALIF